MNFNNPFWSIVFNIIGGLLTIPIYEGCKWLHLKYKGRRFKSLLGITSGNYQLIYGKLRLGNSGTSDTKFTYTKPGIQYTFSASSVISSVDNEAIKYLVEAIAKQGLNSPELVTDEEPIVAGEVFSYCAIAGRNNYKSNLVLDNQKNKFYKHSSDISRYDDPLKKFTTNSPLNSDYALIIKIKNEFFPDKTMMCVAGLGELGTSGGAWFLANKWNEIYSKIGDKEFGCIIWVSGEVHNSKLIEYSFMENGKIIYQGLN